MNRNVWFLSSLCLCVHKQDQPLLIIGHSMGARLVASAMARPQPLSMLRNLRWRDAHRFVFCAPDAEQALFISDMNSWMDERNTRALLLTSSRDNALKWSRVYRQRVLGQAPESRAGDCSISWCCNNNFITIDCSRARTHDRNHHGYVFCSPQVALCLQAFLAPECNFIGLCQMIEGVAFELTNNAPPQRTHNCLTVHDLP